MRAIVTSIAVVLFLLAGTALAPAAGSALGSTGAGELVAQQGPGTGLASQSMRPYAHVFWAYGLAWLIILGWIASIARRWSRVEKELGDASGGS